MYTKQGLISNQRCTEYTKQGLIFNQRCTVYQGSISNVLDNNNAEMSCITYVYNAQFPIEIQNYPKPDSIT